MLIAAARRPEPRQHARRLSCLQLEQLPSPPASVRLPRTADCAPKHIQTGSNASSSAGEHQVRRGLCSRTLLRPFPINRRWPCSASGLPHIEAAASPHRLPTLPPPLPLTHRPLCRLQQHGGRRNRALLGAARQCGGVHPGLQASLPRPCLRAWPKLEWLLPGLRQPVYVAAVGSPDSLERLRFRQLRRCCVVPSVVPQALDVAAGRAAAAQRRAAAEAGTASAGVLLT